MPDDKTPLFYLDAILDAINAIQDYTQSMIHDQFLQDKKTRDAVVRNLEVIGEAIKSLPEEFRTKYPTVNWKGFAGMRDKLIHQYFGVDWEIVWKTVTRTLPDLKKLLTSIKGEDPLFKDDPLSVDVKNNAGDVDKVVYKKKKASKPVRK